MPRLSHVTLGAFVSSMKLQILILNGVVFLGKSSENHLKKKSNQWEGFYGLLWWFYGGFNLVLLGGVFIGFLILKPIHWETPGDGKKPLVLMPCHRSLFALRILSSAFSKTKWSGKRRRSHGFFFAVFSAAWAEKGLGWADRKNSWKPMKSYEKPWGFQAGGSRFMVRLPHRKFGGLLRNQHLGETLKGWSQKQSPTFFPLEMVKKHWGPQKPP